MKKMRNLTETEITKKEAKKKKKSVGQEFI